LRTQTVIAERRHYFTREISAKMERQASEIDRMLSGLISSLSEKIGEVEED
jgi:hypothetical protein